jgi:hypothetical protein
VAGLGMFSFPHEPRSSCLQIPYRLSNWRNSIASRAIDAARLFIESRIEEQIKQEEEQEAKDNEGSEFCWCFLTRILKPA